MDISKLQDQNGLTLILSGNVDSSAAPKLEAELIPELDNFENIVLDLKDIKYISSAGMRVLLMGEKKAKAKGGKQTIKNVSPFVMEIFDVTGFQNILNFE